VLPNDAMSPLFLAVIEATEEAALCDSARRHGIQTLGWRLIVGSGLLTIN
jgi:hypothetical protein